MKKNLTEMVFILDRSGSMSGLESDTVGGFNSLIEKQKKHEGEALVTTVLFNHRTKTLHDRVPLDRIESLTTADYTTTGNTALLDAVGETIQHIKKVHHYIREEDRPENTMVVITTDGMENSSREFSRREVKRMIEERREDGWEFIFLGANIDAESEAESFGIPRSNASSYRCDSVGTRRNFSAVSRIADCVRDCEPVPMGWNEEILDYLNGED